jgi:beta-glucosidase
VITIQTLQQRAETLLTAMTLEEKAGQLSQYFHLTGLPPQNALVEGEVRAGRAGSLLFVSDPRETNRLQRIAVEESRLGIPLLFGFDVIHGLRTIFPVPLGLAASWDPQLAEQVQATAAREARAVGIHWAFAPMVDIARDPRWGRIVEGAGEDPYLGAQMAAAQVRGFQGEAPGALGTPDHIVAGPKHYAGYGAALGGRDYDEVNLSEGALRNVYLPPFAAAVEAGAGNIMTSYVGIDGVPGAADRRLITTVLRGELGFDGFVVSDAHAVVDLVTHGFARDERDAAARALGAGLDMEMSLGMRFTDGMLPTPGAFATLPDAVRAGEVDEGLLNAAVRRILLLKLRLGLFEQPYVDEARAASVLQDPVHRELARIAAERSAVLLRNEGGVLPIDQTAVRSVAVIGPFADDKRAVLGPWVFAPNLQETVTVLEGIRHVAGESLRVEHAPGVSVPERQIPSPFAALEHMQVGGEPQVASFDEPVEFARAVELARTSDVAVLVLGEAADMSGEAASRSTLDLPGRQLELLEAVAATGTPVVLVLLSGRPLDLRRAIERSAAILAVWHPGTEGGLAVARLLFGDVAPRGKLPLTWPRSVGQVPLIYARLNSHQPHTSALRYWEEESTPLYPFGFGLTYGTVEYANLRLSATAIGLDDTIEASVEVRNPSSQPVEEVAQLYLHQRYGRAARPVRELKGFERVMLEPGETRTLHFAVPAAARRYWSAADGAYVLDASTFDVWVGGASSATLHAEFAVREDSSAGSSTLPTETP